MKETLKNIAYVLSLAAVIVSGILFIGYDIHKDSKVYENAQRYARENNCECYGNKGSIVYTFSNYSIIGEDVLYKMY
jgi:uncharacterized protein YxeA